MTIYTPALGRSWLRAKQHTVERKRAIEPDFERFCAVNLRILDKQQRLVPLYLNRMQRHLLANLTGRDLVLKSRQLGTTTFIAARNYHKSILGTESMITLAHEDETTQKIRRMVDRFWLNMSDAPQRGMDNARVTTYPETDSTSVIATAGNRNTGRGGTYSQVHGSEAAFWKDAKSIMAGLMQGGNPEVVLEFTPNGAQGAIYEWCMAALNTPDQSPWALHFYPWWWDDDYHLPVTQPLRYTPDEAALIAKHGLDAEQIQWRRAKQLELGELFAQEYPEDPVGCFLTSGRGVFSLTPAMLLENAAKPLDGHRYVMGVDWGQSNDYTAFSLVDATDYREVYLHRTRQRPWHSMVDDIVDYAGRWKVEKIVPEHNSIGMVNIEILVHALQEAGLNVAVQSFNMNNRRKDMLVKLFQRGLYEDDYRVLDMDFATQELQQFQTKQTTSGLWTYSHPDGGHDDTVVARLLGHYAATQLF